MVVAHNLEFQILLLDCPKDYFTLGNDQTMHGLVLYLDWAKPVCLVYLVKLRVYTGVCMTQNEIDATLSVLFHRGFYSIFLGVLAMM